MFQVQQWLIYSNKIEQTITVSRNYKLFKLELLHKLPQTEWLETIYTYQLTYLLWMSSALAGCSGFSTEGLTSWSSGSSSKFIQDIGRIQVLFCDWRLKVPHFLPACQPISAPRGHLHLLPRGRLSSKPAKLPSSQSVSYFKSLLSGGDHKKTAPLKGSCNQVPWEHLPDLKAN